MFPIFNTSRNWFFKLAVPPADHLGSVSSEQQAKCSEIKEVGNYQN